MPYLGKSPTQAVRARYYYTVASGATSVTGSDDNSNTLIFSDGEFVDVSLNGVTLVAGTDYVTSTANTIGSLSAMSANDVVEVVVYDVFSVFDGNVNSNFSVGGDLDVTGGITTGGSLNAVTDIIGTSSDMTIKNTVNGQNIFVKTTSGNSLITPVKIHSGGVFEAKLGAVFNEDSADVDFRVESNGNANMLFVDGGNDVVGIGANNNTTYDSIAQTLLVANESGHAGITIRGGGTNPFNAIHFSDGVSDNSEKRAGRIVYQHETNNMTFQTANAERMRITSSGNVGIGTSAPGHPFEVKKGINNDFGVELDNSSGTGPYGLSLKTSGATSDNNTTHFLFCADATATRLVIDSDGDVKNHDNSYGAISDERVKQNISDASSQWDDIKALKVRKFKLKDDVRAYGDDAKFKLGLVSQEAEKVSPNIISESAANANDILSSSEFGTLYTKDDKETQDVVLYTKDDKDEDGNLPENIKVGDIKTPSTKQIGDIKERKTTVKAIKYSILYMKAVKALQEAITRIETLETKVKALEDA